MAMTLPKAVKWGAVKLTAMGTLLGSVLVGCQDPPTRDDWQHQQMPPVPTHAQTAPEMTNQGWAERPQGSQSAGGNPNSYGTNIREEAPPPAASPSSAMVHEHAAPVDHGMSRVMEPIDGDPPMPIQPTSFTADPVAEMPGVPSLPDSSHGLPDAPFPVLPAIGEDEYDSRAMPIEPTPPAPPGSGPISSSNYPSGGVEFQPSCPNGKCPTEPNSIDLVPPPPLPDSFNNSPIDLPPPDAE